MPIRQATPWQRPATAWQIDGRRMPVTCPPTLHLVSLLVANTSGDPRGAPEPVFLVMGTLARAADRAHVYRLILGGDIDDALLADIADALAFSWTGMSRWFAVALWREALSVWSHIEGPLTGRGVDLAQVPPARATRYLWSTLSTMHASDKDKGEAWRRRITTEPAPEIRRRVRTAAAVADRAADAEAFQAALNRFGGRR